MPAKSGRVGNQYRGGTAGCTQFVEDDGFIIEVVFTRTFYFHNQIISRIASLECFVQVPFYGFDGDIIHELHTGRRYAGLYDFIDDADGCRRIVEYGEQVQLEPGLGKQFQCGFGDDAQCSFRADNQLIQAVSCRLLLQAGTELYNPSRRIYDFDGIDLMAGRTIFDGPVAPALVAIFPPIKQESPLQGSPA